MSPESVLALATALALLLSCSRDSPPAPPNPQDGAEITPTQRPVRPLPGKGARVVADTSGSMRGFVAPPAIPREPARGAKNAKKAMIPSNVALETIHRAIDEVLSRHGMNAPEERCLLGGTLSCGKPVKYSDFCDPRLYRDHSSRLDLALIRPKKPADANPAAPAPPDNLDPFHVTVLVTDGMQAVQAAAGSVDARVPVASDVACVAGPDPACVAALLRERVSDGYGLWVIGVRLSFNGPHFAERSLDAGHWARVAAHLDNLKRQADWYGQEFAVSGLKTDKASGTSFYEYTGVKPLLLLVLSRDWDRGRAFTTDLASRLTAERIGRPERGGVEWIEISPLGETVAAFNGARRVDGPKSDHVILDPVKRAGPDMMAPLRCDAEGASYIDLFTVRGSEGPALPAWVTDTVTLEPGARVLDGKIVKRPEAAGESTYRTGVNCAILATGRSVASFNLVVRRSVASSYPPDTWWIRWSSDNTYEMPEAVFGLRALVDSVLRPANTWERVAGVVYLRIDRE